MLTIESMHSVCGGYRALELCESRGGRPGLPVPNKPYGLCGRKATLNYRISELRSCVKVEVAVLGSPSIISLMVYVDIKQHRTVAVCSSSYVL